MRDHRLHVGHAARVNRQCLIERGRAFEHEVHLRDAARIEIDRLVETLGAAIDAST